MWGDAAQFPTCQDSSLAMASLSEGQRGDRGRTSVLALEGIILQSLTRWPVSSRKSRTLVHQWQAAAIPPLKTWNPGDGSKVLSSSECDWGGVLSPRRSMEPLMKAAWAVVDELPRTWDTFGSKIRVCLLGCGEHLLRDSS